jgi:hypothetical protein
MAPSTPIKRSNNTLDFWGPIFTDADNVDFSPGFVEYPENYNVWDYVVFTINGKQVFTPGVADVRFLRSKEKDKKKSVGQDSSTTTTSGIKAAEIVIELELWMPDHWVWLNAYMPILFPKPNKSPQAKAVRSTTTVIGTNHPLFISEDNEDLQGRITSANTIVSSNLGFTAKTQTIPQVAAPAASSSSGGVKSQQPTFAVQHPLFKAANIKAVVLHGWEGPLKHTVPRGKIFRIHCTEYQATTKIPAGGTAEVPSRALEATAAAGVSLPGKNQASKTK